jgi:hypothetical protein
MRVVHRLICSWHMVRQTPDQLAVYQGASDEHILIDT